MTQDYFEIEKETKDKKTDTTADLKFMLSIASPPSPRPLAGQSFYTNATATKLAKAQLSRRFIVDGFKFCKTLNGAVLDAITPIKALKGSVASVNPNKESFVNLLDAMAIQARDFVVEKYDTVEPKVSQTHLGSPPICMLCHCRWSQSYR